MAGLEWLLVPLLTPGAVMAAALVLQRVEDAVLPAGRADPAGADALVGQDVGATSFPASTLRTAMSISDPRL